MQAALLGVADRGMGGACFIKALFSPGVVLYQCIIRKTKQTKHASP